MPELFGFALAVTGPIFMWVLLGLVLRRLGWLTDEVNQTVSTLVFRVGLPIVLFFGATQVDYSLILGARYLMAGILATLSIFTLALLYGQWRGMERGDRCVFVQASYRSNLGVIGIALAAEAYGAQGLALAALPVAVMTIVYNLIAVPLLGYGYGRSLEPGAVLKSIFTNPLILGIGGGVVVSLSGAQLPGELYQSGRVFSAVIIPVALLCIGASLDLRVLRKSSGLTIDATLWRLLLGPALGVTIAIFMGVHGAELAVIFLLLASPAAAASYIMVAAAGGNGPLAANIVVVSTLLSSLTITLGLAALQWFGFI